MRLLLLLLISISAQAKNDNGFLTANRVTFANALGQLDTSDLSLIELERLIGVTSNVQAQLDNKCATVDLTNHTSDTNNPHGTTAALLGGNNIVTEINARTGLLNWARISKTGASIADIPTRSHADLSDVGTNTHAQIDTAITNSTNHIASVSTHPDSSMEISNLGLSASVGSNALTIALKTKSGADPSASSPVSIGFRSSTATSGTYNRRTVTGALSLTISSGSTLGHLSAKAEYVYVYAIDYLGAVALAVTGSPVVSKGSLVSTTAEGGAGAADSRTIIYSATARTNVPIRYIGRIKTTQATAGTWVTAPSEVSVQTLDDLDSMATTINASGSVQFGATLNCDSASVITSQDGTTSAGVASIGNISSGACAVTFAGVPISGTRLRCFSNLLGTTLNAFAHINVTSATAATLYCVNAGAAATACDVDIFCVGVR